MILGIRAGISYIWGPHPMAIIIAQGRQDPEPRSYGGHTTVALRIIFEQGIRNS
jgi:hypothetical protein